MMMEFTPPLIICIVSIHHHGYGDFTVDGEIIHLESRMP